jgi:hypothetical protein
MFETKNQENLTKTVCLAQVLVRASLYCTAPGRNCLACKYILCRFLYCKISGTNRVNEKTKYVLECPVHFLDLVASQLYLKKVFFLG